MEALQVIARLERWGPVDLTELLSSWRFTTRAGVGFDTAEITVEGPEPGLWVLQDHGAEDTLEFWGSGEMAWRGLLAGGGLQGRGALATVMQLSAEGAGLRLRDTEVWRMFCDPDYGRWVTQDKIPDGFGADNNNRVYVEARRGTYTDTTECEISYPETGVVLGADIVRVDAHASAIVHRGAWDVELRDDAGNVLWQTAIVQSDTYTLFLDGATGGTFKLGDGATIETVALNHNDGAAVIESALQTAYSDASITVAADSDFTVIFPTGGPDLQLTNNSLTYAVSCAPTSAKTAEAYAVFLDGPTGGTFRLGDGATMETTDLAYNATAADIESALRTAYGVATITVVDGEDFIISFSSGGNNLQLTNNSLTYDAGGTPTCTLVDAYTLFLDGATGGTFKLGDGATMETADLDYNATAADIESALQTAYSEVTIIVVEGDDFVVVFPTGGTGMEITDNGLTRVANCTPTCILVDDPESVSAEISEIVASAGLVWALRKNGTGTGEAEARLTEVIVRTLYPCTSSVIISTLLSAAGLDTEHITDSGLTVDRAAWQGQSYLEALSEMAALGDGEEAWLFAVYDTATFGAWETAALWRLEREDLPQWRVEWRRDAVINAVRAELPDGWRSAWLTDPDSIARWGRRELTLPLPMTTRAEAERLATVFLEERSWPLAALQISAGSRCRKADRSTTWPIWMVRAGDVVVLHDLLPDEDRLVQIAETEMTADGMRITPRGVDSRLEVILAGMERRR